MINAVASELCRVVDTNCNIYLCESAPTTSTLSFTLTETSLVVFKHGLGEVVVCDAGQFQVYVWGSDKYTVWELPSGARTCLVLREVYIDLCSDIYVVSRRPNECREVKFHSCEQELSKLLAQVNSQLFLIVGDVEIHRELINTLRRGDHVNACLEKIEFIKNKLLQGQDIGN
ncbi:MAG: hypothetical protein ACO2OR_02205 [Desulfurococcaceae archaeon]